MSYRCPKCNGVIYDRRNYVCGSCGAELPATLLFLPPEMADKLAGETSIPIELLARALMELRKARGNFQATRDVVIRYFKDGIAGGFQVGPLLGWLFSWPTRRDSVFSQVGYSVEEMDKFMEILKEKHSARELGLRDDQMPPNNSLQPTATARSV